jgi:hypothetical protein
MPKAISFAAERTSTNAVTWWFAPAGGFLAALLMYGTGIPMTFSDWLPENSVVRAGFEVLVCVVVAYAVIFVFWLVWYAFVHRLRIKLNPWLVAVSLGAVITIGGTSGYFWDRSRGPILWDWSFRWLNNNYAPTLNRIVINRFEIVGDNRWDDPVVVSEAFIRSDITNQRIDMDVHLKAGGNTWTSTTTKVVPSKGRFLLYGKFNPDPNNYQGLPDNEFKDQFGQFSFYFNGKLVRRFYPNEVEKLILKLHEEKAKNPD